MIFYSAKLAILKTFYTKISLSLEGLEISEQQRQTVWPKWYETLFHWKFKKYCDSHML